MIIGHKWKIDKKTNKYEKDKINPKEEELESISARIMSNEEEVKRITEQLNSQKLLKFIKENAKLKTKEITYDKFIKEAYN